jgi:hypothetical protein
MKNAALGAPRADSLVFGFRADALPAAFAHQKKRQCNILRKMLHWRLGRSHALLLSHIRRRFAIPCAQALKFHPFPALASFFLYCNTALRCCQYFFCGFFAG